MSHADTIASVPESFEVVASTPSVAVAAYKIKNKSVYGIQFHPEVTHTLEGKNLLRNFVVHICGCKQDWTPDQFVEATVADLQKKLGNDKVVMALSGGVELHRGRHTGTQSHWQEPALHICRQRPVAQERVQPGAGFCISTWASTLKA